MVTETTVPAFESIRLAVVTDKGRAVTAAYALLSALRPLDQAERADVLELLELELAEQLA